MGPKSKSSGVSTSTFFDLRAEIAKHEEEFAKNKAAGKGRAIMGGVKRPDKVCDILIFLVSMFSKSNSVCWGFVVCRNQPYGRNKIRV